MDSVIETKAITVLGFIKSLHGSLWVTFEERTSAAWLYDFIYDAQFPVAGRNRWLTPRQRMTRSRTLREFAQSLSCGSVGPSKSNCTTNLV